MEINKKNKKLFDEFSESVVKQPDERQKANDEKYAILRVIHRAAHDRDYKVVHGSVPPTNLKLYDVVLSFPMVWFNPNGFYLVVSADEEAGTFRAVRVLGGHNSIDDDTLEYIEMHYCKEYMEIRKRGYLFMLWKKIKRLLKYGEALLFVTSQKCL